MTGDLPLPESSLEDQARRADAIQTFGNLTLVTEKLNSSMLNGPWSVTKAALLEHSVLTMNRRLQSVAKWDEGVIAARSKELSELALKIWPRPT